jgi:hypothetical protein
MLQLRTRFRAAHGILILISAVGLSACTVPSTNDPRALASEPAPSPSPTQLTLPDITHEEAYAQVPPLDGTPPVVINWELPEVDDPEVAEALDVMRMFVALREDDNRLSPQAPYEKAYLYYFLATEEYADLVYPLSQKPASTPLLGPLWYWVMDLRRTGDDEIQIDTCVDIGWYVSEPAEAPRPTPNRGSLRTYILELVQGDDGVERWKVDGVDPNSVARVGQAAQDACDEWAVHTPDDA